MAYIVVKHFTDLQDHGHKYAEGDTYPREGYVPSDERIKMLSTAMNRQKTVLIEAVPEVIPDMDRIQALQAFFNSFPPAYEENAMTESAEVVEESAVEETAEEKPKRKSRKKAE